MIDPALLRCTVALAHTVPGATLRLHTDDGRSVDVSHHPGAQLSPCSLRRTVLASSLPGHPPLSSWITDVEVGGSLSVLAAGLYLVQEAIDDEPSVWFATPVTPAVVADVLAEAPIDDGEDEPDVTVALRADTALGITVVGVRRDGDDVDVIDVALRAHARCLVAELTAVLPTNRLV